MTGTEISTIVYINDITTGTATGTAININTLGYYSFNGIAWVKLSNSGVQDNTIYNIDGTLTGNKTVNQGTRKLAFTTNIVNGFSVGENTFSVDGLNHRIGIGAKAPNALLQFSNNLANRKIVLYNYLGNNDHQFLGFGNNTNGGMRYQTAIYDNFHIFYSGINATSSRELMRISALGNIGIGTASSTAKLELSSGVANTSGLKFTNLSSLSPEALGQPIGVDASGNIVRSPLDISIYSSNGTLTDNRTVSQDDKKLTFTSNTVNGFSVDGNTFSIDTQNNRVGIGTIAPNAPLQFANPVTNRIIVLSEEANNDHQYNGWGVNASAVRYQTASPNTDHIFYSGINASSSKELMRIEGNGSVGIGKAPDPAAILEIFATDKGFLPPRLTTAQRNAILGVTPGLMIYNTDINCMQFRLGSTWQDKCGKGIITNLDCLGVINTGTITEGITVGAGVTSAIPYSGGNGGEFAAQTITSTGVPGLTATIAAGAFANGNGTLTYTISGIALASGTASFTVNIGGQTCTFTIDVAANTAGYIASLDCAGATHTGALTNGTNVGAGVTSTISYTGGNGGTYPAQSVNSIGVTGLVATLAAGSFNNGDGTLIYTITGRPNNAGTATFTLNIGGQTCNITRTIGGIPGPDLGVSCGST